MEVTNKMQVLHIAKFKLQNIISLILGKLQVVLYFLKFKLMKYRNLNKSLIRN